MTLNVGSGFTVMVMNGKRISQLADTVGVATSTVRYYERIGLVDEPQRTATGYRVYSEQAEARLRFIVRGKRLGLSLEEIAQLLAVWDGTNCAETQDHLCGLLDGKQREIAAHIEELGTFAAQLREVHAQLLATPAPTVCSAELECCAPDLHDTTVPVVLVTQGRAAARLG